MVATSSVEFWVIVCIMTLVLMGFVGAGLLGFFNQKQDNETSTYNRIVYEDQLNELKHDFQRGAITKAQYDEGVEEIDRRVLEEMDRKEESRKSFLTWKSGIPFLLAIPLLAFGIYSLAGNPSLISYSPNGKDTATWDSAGNVQLKGAELPSLGELKAYLKNSPKDSRAWLQLSYVYQRDGNKQEALDAMDKAFETSPHKMAEDSGMMTERAILMLEVQNPELVDKAQSELNKAIEANPENSTAKEILGMIYFKKGNYQQAADIWSQVVELYPAGSPQAIQLLDVIAEAKNRAMMGLPGSTSK